MLHIYQIKERGGCYYFVGFAHLKEVGCIQDSFLDAVRDRFSVARVA